ncbi:hypothetical protein ES703_47379 [subsurface metagenome]
MYPFNRSSLILNLEGTVVKKYVTAIDEVWGFALDTELSGQTEHCRFLDSIRLSDYILSHEDDHNQY